MVAAPVAAAVMLAVFLMVVGLRHLGVAVAVPAWLPWLPWWLGAVAGVGTVVLGWWSALLCGARPGEMPPALAVTLGWAVATVLCVLTGAGVPL